MCGVALQIARMVMEAAGGGLQMPNMNAHMNPQGRWLPSFLSQLQLPLTPGVDTGLPPTPVEWKVRTFSLIKFDTYGLIYAD